MLRVIKEVLTPGNPELKAHLTRMDGYEARLVKYLHLLDLPAIQELNTGTDEAAEF